MTTDRYDPEYAIRVEQDLMKLAARLEGEDAETAKRAVDLIVFMWAKLALVRQAVK